MKMLNALAGIPFLAAALSGAQATEKAGHACLEGEGMTDSQTDGATVIRSGSGHSATIIRSEGAGTLHLEQHGEDHAAMTVQSGSGDRLVIDQSGRSAEAEVRQDGACNDTDLVQAGDGNRATVSQSGSGNRVVVRQGSARKD